jgi:predicted transcriptional regulator
MIRNSVSRAATAALILAFAALPALAQSNAAMPTPATSAQSGANANLGAKTTVATPAVTAPKAGLIATADTKAKTDVQKPAVKTAQQKKHVKVVKQSPAQSAKPVQQAKVPTATDTSANVKTNVAVSH